MWFAQLMWYYFSLRKPDFSISETTENEAKQIRLNTLERFMDEHGVRYDAQARVSSFVHQEYFD
jgi:hypothetical protein